MKKTIIFIISLIVLSVSLKSKNLAILAFVSSTLRLDEGNKIFEGISKEDFIEELVRLGEEKEKILKLDKHRLIRDYEVLRYLQ